MTLVLLAITPFFVKAQDTIPKFVLTTEGIAPIVLQLEGMKAADIYKKTLNYVQETYKNPSEVLKADIINEMVRINGYKRNAWSQKLPMTPLFYYDMEYTLEIEFKDNKTRLILTPVQFWAGDTKALFTHMDILKDTKGAKKFAIEAKPGLEKAMNEIALSYYNYIKGNEKKSDW